MQVKVKIIQTVVTAQFGTLVSGDVLVTDSAFAKHLVDDCKAAEFITAPDGESKRAAVKTRRGK